jgi:tetratricopeptide (TPR) repeat protein
MNKTPVDQLATVSELLQAGDFLAALRVVESIDANSLPSDARLQYYSVYSEVAYFNGDYSRALELSYRCLTEISDKRCTEYAKQKHIHGKILQQSGNLTGAEECFTESYATFQQLGDFANAVLPLDSLASVHYLRADFQAAVRCLEREIVLRTEHGLLHDLPRCRNNQARIRVYLGDLLEAAPALRALVAEDISDLLRYSAIYLLGMIASFKRQHVRAHSLLEKSLDYYQRTGSSREVVICLEYLGLNEHFSGNQEKAREYFQGILARDQITASARAQTLRMLTDVYVAEGDYSEALTTADQAEVAITKINERIEIGCLHRSRTRIAAATGNEPEARRQFAASVEMLQMIGAQYELAETYLLGGQLDLFEIKSRHEFLKQAVLLFVKCGVTARANVAALQLSRLLPPVPDRGEDLSSPLASAYVACQLLKTDWQ